MSTAATVRKTALITGASGGIGFELARCFARGGYRLVLVARDAKRLDDQALKLGMESQVPITAIAKDLARPGAAQQLVEECEAQDLAITVLVNNAGFATYGPFAEADLAKELEMIQLNVAALTALTSLVLPGMRERRHGRILNVASTAAFQPGPLMAVYYASKAYVLHFSEALANELAGSGITVTCLCPGPTETGFVARADMGASKLFKSGVMAPAEVARLGYEGCLKGRTIVIPGLVNRLLAWAPRIAPRAWAAALVRKVQEPA